MLNGRLPSAANEAMLLHVDCVGGGAGEPASMTVQIRDLDPVSPPTLSLQARRSFAAKSTTDAVDGDAAASPVVALNEGAGRYDLYVDKNLAGEEDFEVSAQCWSGIGGTGAPTATILQFAGGVPVPSGSTAFAIALTGILSAIGSRAARAGRRSRRGQSRRAIQSTLLVVTISGFGSAAIAPSLAEAHSQPGNLGVAASATDYYEIACFNDGHGQPASLEIQIRDASPGAAPFVSVQAHFGLTVRSVSDDLVADIEPSARTFLNGGAVTYVVLVDKSGSGAKFYDLTYHCWTGPDGTGIHTGSALVPRQSE